MVRFALLALLWNSPSLLAAASQDTLTTCRSEAMRGGTAITYSVRSGITGMIEQWVIYPSGLVCRGIAEKGRVPPQLVARLMDDVTNAGFFNLKDSYCNRKVEKLCYGCNHYRVTVLQGANAKTIETHDGAGKVPAVLWDIISRIQEVLPRRLRK
jgi:hypothetical protein